MEINIFQIIITLPSQRPISWPRHKCLNDIDRILITEKKSFLWKLVWLLCSVQRWCLADPMIALNDPSLLNLHPILSLHSYVHSHQLCDDYVITFVDEQMNSEGVVSRNSIIICIVTR